VIIGKLAVICHHFGLISDPGGVNSSGRPHAAGGRTVDAIHSYVGFAVSHRTAEKYRCADILVLFQLSSY